MNLYNNLQCFFSVWGGGVEGYIECSREESDTVKAHSFLPSGGGKHHHSITGMS